MYALHRLRSCVYSCACCATAERSLSDSRLGGFELVSVKGSHHKFRKGTITVVVPHPKKDLPFGTARSIAKQVGWD